MWRNVGESVAGTSHLASSTECQDACSCLVLNSGPDEVLVFAVSDGAGSARHASIGAKLTTEIFCRELAALPVVSGAISATDLIAICEKIRIALIARSTELECSLRELSATLVGGCVSQKSASFIQIGDGGIVVVQDGVYRAPTWPSSGEYVNTTTFITSDDWQQQMQLNTIDGRIDALAAFSDGLQELTLEYSSKTVHGAFFAPMFDTLRASPTTTALAQPLRNFLESKAVIQRTDDDKTLFLACWVD